MQEFFTENDRVKFFKKYLISKNYSPRTISLYMSALLKFIKYYGRETRAVTHEELITYLAQESKTKSYTTVNLYKEVLKQYFKTIYDKKYHISLWYSRKEKKLPVILSLSEVSKLLNSYTNQKHKILLSLAYGTGMRVSEIAMLQKADIDFDRMIIHIKSAKWKKDRIVPLPNRLKQDIETFVHSHSSLYVFPSEQADYMSPRTLQLLLQQGVQRIQLHKKISFHTLRHSFATHLLESWTDIRYIQNLLGHTSIKTTQIYTHVVQSAIDKIISPFDRL